ncbi:MAG TPA: OmpH family outer membrane protein [Gemmatimonadales bacterium]
MTMRRDVMQVTSLLCTAALLPAALIAQSPCATSHVAFVSSGQILASMKSYVVADSQLNAQQLSYKAEVDKQSGVLDSMYNALNEKATLMTPSQKQAEGKKLQDMQAALQQRVKDLTKQSTDDRTRLLGPMEQQVQDVIDGVRAELNCAMIFDVSSQTGIASADKSLDLTQRIIDRLAEANKPVAAPSKPAPTGIRPPAASTPHKP